MMRLDFHYGRNEAEHDTEVPRRRGIADAVVGAIAGAVVGVVVAVNFVIFSGIEGGYEATLPEVFEQSFPAGIITVLILLAGPILGGWLNVRRRR